MLNIFENGNPGRLRKKTEEDHHVEIAHKLHNYCGLPDHAFNPSSSALGNLMKFYFQFLYQTHAIFFI